MALKKVSPPPWGPRLKPAAHQCPLQYLAPVMIDREPQRGAIHGVVGSKWHKAFADGKGPQRPRGRPQQRCEHPLVGISVGRTALSECLTPGSERHDSSL